MNENKSELLWKSLYNMLYKKLLILQKTLIKYLNKNFIHVSNLFVNTSVLFVKKSDKKLHFCVDYHTLNKLMKKNHYFLFLINKTLEQISKTRWFTKLDIIYIFHKIQIAEKDEWLTIFQTQYRLFEWLVIFFELMNVSSTFQKYINWILQNFLNKFTLIYLNDILIFSSDNLKKYQEHICKIFQQLRNIKLQLDVDKCKFKIEIIKYLMFIIKADKELCMNFKKIKTIIKWEVSQSIKNIYMFLEFINFYQQFIKNFSKIIIFMTTLTQKNSAFK